VTAGVSRDQRLWRHSTPEDMVVKKTAQDVRELKSLARQKTPAVQIARKLKRTEGATRQKALTLNVSLNSRPGKRKTPK
jgi:hypothetical protein